MTSDLTSVENELGAGSNTGHGNVCSDAVDRSAERGDCETGDQQNGVHCASGDGPQSLSAELLNSALFRPQPRRRQGHEQLGAPFVVPQTATFDAKRANFVHSMPVTETQEETVHVEHSAAVSTGVFSPGVDKGSRASVFSGEDCSIFSH